MRVIAGKYRRRNLKTPSGQGTRPMPDRLRESMFNIIAAEIEGAAFADLYAGSGAVGIEALSRGAAGAVFVETDPDAVDIIRDNLRLLGAEADARVLQMPVRVALAQVEADAYFLGPPYAAVEEYETALAELGRRAAPLVLAQHPSTHDPGESFGALGRFRLLKQGRNCVSFYRPSQDAA